MKVIHLHNRYRIRGGEDAMVDATVGLLSRSGVDVRLVTRESAREGTGLRGKTLAFFSGIYSPSSAAMMRETILREKPDVVHVHNLHPFLSPSVLTACQRARVPVIMTCHNYRLVCPAGMHMRRDKICQLCLRGREYWCALTNCKENWLQSAGYALRNMVHRRLRLFTDNVSLFIAVSNSVRDHLVDSGLPADRVSAVPNMVEIPDVQRDYSKGTYIAFAGRFSPQKGIGTLLEATGHAKLPLKLAGDASPMAHVREKLMPGVETLGLLKPREMKAFYQGARFAVVPSNCMEPFGLVAAEAMSHGLPVIASRIGGLREIVEDEVTGLLFEPGNAKDLANKMKRLWDDADLCRRLGMAGREKAIREYREEVYLGRLLQTYERAIGIMAAN